MSQTGVWSVAWRMQARNKVSFWSGANMATLSPTTGLAQLMMLNHQAKVLHHNQARVGGLLGGGVIHHANL